MPGQEAEELQHVALIRLDGLRRHVAFVTEMAKPALDLGRDFWSKSGQFVLWSHRPLVPAQAGTQLFATFSVLVSRFRGSERSMHRRPLPFLNRGESGNHARWQSVSSMSSSRWRSTSPIRTGCQKR